MPLGWAVAAIGSSEPMVVTGGVRDQMRFPPPAKNRFEEPIFASFPRGYSARRVEAKGDPAPVQHLSFSTV